jgi:hypothetical protein
MKKEISGRGKYIDKTPNSGEAELDFGHNSDEETWGAVRTNADWLK